MDLDVATSSPSSSKDTGEQPDAGMEVSAIDMLYTRFADDDDGPSDEASKLLDELEFPSIDFESMWDEMKNTEEEDSDEYRKLLEDIVVDSRNNPSAVLSPSYNYPVIADDELLEQLIEDQKYLKWSFDVPTRSGFVRSSRKSDDGSSTSSEGQPSPKKPRDVNKKRQNSRSSKRNSESNDRPQYAFVTDVSTRQKKVIAIGKGEELPKGLKLASIQDDFSNVGQLPDELSTVQVGAIQGAIRNTTRPSSPPRLAASVTVAEVPTRCKSGPNLHENKLASLQDLMENESRKKTSSDESPFAADDSKSRSRFAYKSSSNLTTPKIISVHSVRGANSANDPVLDIIPVQQSNDVGGNLTNQGSFRITTSMINTRISSTITTSKNIAKSPTQRPTSFVPRDPLSLSPTQESEPALTMTLNGGDRISVLLTCPECGGNFPCYNDSLFRRHVFIKHDIEISDEKFFEGCRVYKDKIKSCNKCRVFILNKSTEHHAKCQPFVPIKDAFEEIEVIPKNFLKHKCGICGSAFSARYELSNHIEQKHPFCFKKLILEPSFRCAQCLKRFEDSMGLTKHTQICTDRQPRTETIMELARSSLDCDICGNMHPTTQSSSVCYFSRSILRCVLCFSMFKDRNLFFRHLHMYHGLELHIQPKLTLTCPLCPKGGTAVNGRYQEVFPHILADHYQPLLDMLSKNSRSEDGAAQKKQQPLFTPRTGVFNARGTLPGSVQLRLKKEMPLPTTRPLIQIRPTLQTQQGGILINTSIAGTGIILPNILSQAGSIPRQVILSKPPAGPTTYVAASGNTQSLSKVFRDATGKTFLLKPVGTPGMTTTAKVASPGITPVRNLVQIVTSASGVNSKNSIPRND